jgi:ASC-1-like (ASCH) protein
MQVNDIINFRLDNHPNKYFFAKVKKITHYKDFLELIWNEGKEKCGFEKKSMDQSNNIMHKFYTEEEIQKYGVVAIEIERLR